MECPKCHIENRDVRKFCFKCGAKLLLICPECRFENLPGEDFCGECGRDLSLPSEPSQKTLSFDEKLDKIQRYLPKGLTEKILAQRGRIEGERKEVTVMFCDMEGFSHLSESLGPEEAYRIMDKVYETLIHKVHDYDGTVNEMTGDGIMALFGAPIALEDAPQRAIRSAYAIHREMARLSDQTKKEGGELQPIKMRIGINTGPVVVGTLGNDLRVEFKAVGDTVNLSSRMEGLAEPGTTYVTEDTFKLTEGLFRFEALGPRVVKGKEAPVKVYRVIAPSARRTRFDVSAERGLSPFVGRERELELLLDGFERVKEGRGHAFSIVAEAGVGKSRLLYEFRKAVANEDVTFLEGKCLSYSRGITYHPIIDILKSNFDIREEDRDLDIKEKVTNGLEMLGADQASTLPYLLELLSVTDYETRKVFISPEVRKARIREAIKHIILRGSEIRPLIMAFEDLHWIDKSSEEASKELLDNIAGAKILLIFTYRPDFVHSWGGKSYHSQVTLNRLSNRESLKMVAYLLGVENVDRDLEELILEKTEGVPFFIEEFIRSLKELHIIERKADKYLLTKDSQGVTIPSTIQEVIMARVDSLPEAAKEVLQIGSVIEREFRHELVKRVAGLPERKLLSFMSALKDLELLYERGMYPQTTYIFKHALTREVVYDSILTVRKKKIHQEIGRAIEELSRENIDEQYGVLAEHFIEGGDFEKGADYSKLAGKRAAKAASYRDAIEFAKKTVRSLERLPGTEATKKEIIDARTVLAGYYTTLSLLVEAKEAVAPIVDLALALNYERRLPGIYTALGLYSLWVEEDFPKGFQHLNEVSKISEKEKAGTSFLMPLWFTCYYLGATLSWNCKYEKGLEYLKKCQYLSRQSNDLIGIPFAKGSECLNYLYQGKIDSAYKAGEEALQMAIEIGGMFVQGMAYTAYGAACYFKGLFDVVERNLLKGLEFCEKTMQVVWGPFAPLLLAHLYVQMGEYQKADSYYQRGLSVLASHRVLPSFMDLFEVAAARAKVLNGDHNINLDKLFRYYKGNKLKAFEGWMARYISEILLNLNNEYLFDAENWLKQAIEVDKRNKMMWHLGRDYTLHAELFKRKGKPSEAKDILKKAVNIFRECGADGWLEKAEKELTAISR